MRTLSFVIVVLLALAMQGCASTYPYSPVYSDYYTHEPPVVYRTYYTPVYYPPYYGFRDHRVNIQVQQTSPTAPAPAWPSPAIPGMELHDTYRSIHRDIGTSQGIPTHHYPEY